LPYFLVFHKTFGAIVVAELYYRVFARPSRTGNSGYFIRSHVRVLGITP
jgi:hypothetical protein